jgi:hypothetical protein
VQEVSFEHAVFQESEAIFRPAAQKKSPNQKSTSDNGIGSAEKKCK